MKISKSLLNATRISLDGLFKASNADIRTHDADLIPADQPVLYVVNHFTRMETTLLPYLIYKHTKKYTLSLAAHHFFKGRFGNILTKLGAISTKDPERDFIFTGSLLTGEYATLIFPEGQMIKDKQLVEKGKYMIYNMGIRRPPHTGAARLALKAEFYRQKIKYLYENGYNAELESLISHYSIENKDIEKIISLQTWIVPVNITYYPIRAKNNAINRLLEKFVKDIPERLNEELEIEGTMVIDGVDIDVNFGTPISSSEYLDESKEIQKKILNRNPYVHTDQLESAVPLKIPASKLMQRYMDSIYHMTTVNHDHIFAWILCDCGKKRIHETDFKNRANLAIENIKELGISNFHSTLRKRQNFLPADDFHDKYDSFIEACKISNLLHTEGPWVIKNTKKFNLQHPFHSARIDNIAEVLKNEIEPLEKLKKMLNRIMMTPACLIRRSIRKKYIALDLNLFNNHYSRFYIENESKPPEIGRPYFLKPFFARKGIILVHGYMAAPAEMRILADHLYRKGYAVYGVRLRGHGTSPEDLAGTNWEDWYDSVNRGYVIMKNAVKEFAILGFSTGAALTLLQATYRGKKLKGVISISAPLRLQNIASRFSSAVVFWNKILDRMQVKSGKKEFVENNPDNPDINYLRNPVHGVYQLERLMGTLERRLEKIDIPTLIIQGSDDPVVDPSSAREIYNRIDNREKEIVMIESARHGIVRGEEALQVAEHIDRFLKKIF